MILMQEVDNAVETELRAHDSDLAAYLDKLLRPLPEPSEPVPQPQVQDPTVQESERPEFSTDRQDRSWRARSWHSEPSQDAVVPKPTSGSKSMPRKRAKSIVTRRIRTKSRSSKGRSKGSRQVVMKAMIPILAVTLVVLLRHSLGDAAGTGTNAVKLVPTGSAVPASVELTWEVPPPYEYTGRNPMVPMPLYYPQPIDVPVEEAEPTEVENMEVVGLLYGQDRHSAIVGAQIVHEGERIGDVTVIAIDQDGVEFERDGRRWRQNVGNLSMRSGEIEK